MEPNIEEQIAERLAQLPEDVRHAVLSADWEQKIQAIGESHHLHIDQTGALGDLTLMTMLGMSELDEYPARIAQELKIPPADAETIAKEANDGVFMPIRESMKGFSAPRSEPAAPQTPVAPVTTPAPATPTAPNAPATGEALGRTPATGEARPDFSKAETLLNTTVVSMPPVAPPTAPGTAPDAAAKEPPKPQAYPADPYREPPV